MPQFGAGAPVCRGRGAVGPGAWPEGSLFGADDLAAGQEGPDLADVVDDGDGPGPQPEGPAAADARALPEDERSGVPGGDKGPPAELAEVGTGGAGPAVERDDDGPGPFVAGAVGQGASDQEVLAAVIGHYVQSLRRDDKAGEALRALGVDEQTARSFRAGYSDRSLGRALPGKQWIQGAALRSQLARLGLYRASGHEHFVGCLVVPVCSPAGEVMGICGRRLDRGSGDLWASGLPGGWFNAPAAFPAELLVARDVFDALAVISAGRADVVAPGHSGPLSAADARLLAGAGVRRVTLLGPGTGPVAERLKREGIEVCRAGARLALADVLGPAPDRGAALRAVLDEAEAPVSGPAAGTATTKPGATPARSEVSGNASELHVGFAERRWRARSGGRGTGPGSLRVALSVSQAASGRFHLDTVDLYHARARGAYLLAAATELRVSAEALRTELAEVIFAVEAAQASSADKGPERAEMTGAERSAALELLASAHLVGRVGTDLASLGVVGEEANLVVAYLATISRKVERPFGVVVQSGSAAGKSTLADAVAAFVPEEDLVSLSALTAQSLYYLEAGALARKVLFVSEEHGASRAAYALKLLLSEGRLAIAAAGKDPGTGRLRTHSHGVEDPVSLLMTTTAAEVDAELVNRLVVLAVDEEPAQTRAVQAAQRRTATLEGLVDRLRRDATVRLHRNAQRLLEPLPVVVRGAEELSFPDFSARHRRDHQKLLSVIATVALLHQHQRRQGSVEVGGGALVRYVEASPDDMALGARLCEEVLRRGADELSPQARRLLSVMEHQVAQAAAGSPVSFGRRQLRELTGWSEHQVRASLGRLVALEYVAEKRHGPGRRHFYALLESSGPGDGSRPGRAPGWRGPRPSSGGQPGDRAATGAIDGARADVVGQGGVPGSAPTEVAR